MLITRKHTHSYTFVYCLPIVPYFLFFTDLHLKGIVDAASSLSAFDFCYWIINLIHMIEFKLMLGKIL